MRQVKDNDDSKLKKELARLQHRYSLEYEMIRATAAFEHAALRPMFILNGGALGIYLALYGTLAGKTPPAIDFSVGKFAVGFWIAGLLLAWLTAYSGARSQFAFRKIRGREVAQAELALGLRDGSAAELAKAREEYGKEANRFRWGAILLGVTSIALFISGFLTALASIV